MRGGLVSDFLTRLQEIDGRIRDALAAVAPIQAPAAPPPGPGGPPQPPGPPPGAPPPGPPQPALGGAFAPTVQGMPQLRPAVAAPENMQRPGTAAPSQAAFQPPRPPPFASALQAAGQKVGF